MTRFKCLILLGSILATGLTHANKDAYLSNPVSLTRFAIQSLYSPERLISTPPGVYRTPMQTDKGVPLFYGASVEARPLASWRSEQLFVTAVSIRNLLNKPIHLKYQQLIGQWQTAAFYPSANLPARSSHNSTTVILVSDHPFQESLNQDKEFMR